MNEVIIQRYKGKVLGITGSKATGGDYYVDDFLDENIFSGFILDLIDHETDLTTDGYQFLEEYYSIEKLAQMIEEKFPDFSKNPDIGQSTLEWLKVKGQFAIEVKGE